LPRLAREIFDYVCLGDIEELRDIIRDAFGPAHVAEDMLPRFDLPYGAGMFGYIETSRNCNFHCSFCSLTGEGRSYRTYDLDYIRRQLISAGQKQICIIDNNFYGNDRDYFLAKVDLLREFYQSGRIKGWSCLVTADFFGKTSNLDLVRRAGCKAVFSGIESFDRDTLRSYNKKQNAAVPQIEMIRNTLEAGVLFTYGVMLDPTTRSLDELHNEIGFILSRPEITLPSYFTLAIPMLGTPYFRQCVERGLIFPNTRLRNLDGVTLTMQPLDPVDEVLCFARNLPSIRGYRRQALSHVARFTRRYRRRLEPLQLFAALVNGALISTEFLVSSPTRMQHGRPRQTYYGPTETLDPCYRPLIRIPSRYRNHFDPVLITDCDGRLHADVAEDLDAPRQPVPSRETDHRYSGNPAANSTLRSRSVASPS